MFRNYLTTFDLYDEPAQLPTESAAGPWSVALVRADTDGTLHSDVWERHPSGHELLCAVSGAVDVQLRPDGNQEVAEGALVTTLMPGRACFVPAGTWHRLEVRVPGQLLALTPRTRTEHARVGRRGAPAPGEEGRED